MRTRQLIVFMAVVLAILVLAVTCSENRSTGPSNDSGAKVDSIPPGAIANLTILGEVDTVAVLLWTAPGDDAYTGKATSYDCRYSTDSTVLSGWLSARIAPNPPTPLQAGSTQQMAVRGLSLDSLYYFAVKALDEKDNASPISNIAAKRASEIPQIRITSQQNGDFVADLVDIEAVATDNKGITKVQFFVDTVSVGIDITPPYRAQWDSHLQGHGSTHVMYAVATDTDLNSAGSSTVAVVIDSALGYPEAPTLYEVTDIRPSSLVLHWSPNQDNDFLKYGTMRDTSQADVGTWQYSHTVTDTAGKELNLLDDWTYRFKVYAEDRFGHKSYSNTVSATTLKSESKYALQFDGNDIATIVNSAGVLDHEALTVEFWFFASVLAPQVIVAQSGGGIELLIGEHRDIRTTISAGCVGLSNYDQYQALTWHHIAVVTNGQIGTSIMYLDGVQKWSAACSGYAYNPGNLILGQSATAAYKFRGIVDEIRVWNFARTETEINTDFNLALTGNEDGLVGYWRLDEGTGDSIGGLGSYGFFGANDSAPTWVTIVAPISASRLGRA